MGVDFLFKAFDRKTRDLFTVVSDISIFGLAVVLAVYGIKLTLFVRFQTSAALLIPMSVPYSAIWIGGILTSIHSLSFMLSDIENLLNKNNPKEKK